MEPQTITPYLTVRGAAKAIDFYVAAFGATENARMPAEDGRRLMHACLTINGGNVMLSDEFPEFCEGGALAPSAERPAGVAVALHCARPAEVDALYDRAVAAGCTGTTAPHDAFFGLRFAMLGDPFGHRWMLTAPLPQAQEAR
jgi:PhnB protein